MKISSNGKENKSSYSKIIKKKQLSNPNNILSELKTVKNPDY